MDVVGMLVILRINLVVIRPVLVAVFVSDWIINLFGFRGKQVSTEVTDVVVIGNFAALVHTI